MGAATGAMFPFRSSLSLAAAALVFVLPVVGAMLLGGARVGLIGVVLGFVVLDVAFIQPYGTLAVGSGQNWLALIAYVAVVLLVAIVVSRLQQLRTDSARRAADSRRLLELSELLVADKPVLRCSPSSPRASGVPSVSRPLPSCCLQPGPATSRSSRPTAPSSGASHWTASCLSQVPPRRSPAASSPARCCDKYR